jgi:hypothetical protein
MHYKLVLSRFQFIYKQFTYTSAAIVPFCTMHGERIVTLESINNREAAPIFSPPANSLCPLIKVAERAAAAEKLACKVYLRQYRTAADDAHTAKVSTAAPGANPETHSAAARDTPPCVPAACFAPIKSITLSLAFFKNKNTIRHRHLST